MTVESESTESPAPPTPAPALEVLEVKTKLPVFWCGLKQYREALLSAYQAIAEVRHSHPDSTPSNVKAVYMSPWKSHLITPNFAPLIEIVEKFASQVSYEYMKVDFNSINMMLRVTDCWAAIYEEQDYTQAHNHFPADWSVVIYLEAEEGCAPIVFGDGIAVTVVPGLMLMFPGLLLHSVPENKGKRICIAMNLHKLPCLPR